MAVYARAAGPVSPLKHAREEADAAPHAKRPRSDIPQHAVGADSVSARAAETRAPNSRGGVPSESRRNLRILVADDNAGNRRLLEAYLRKFGCTTLVVDTAEGALQATEKDLVHIVLMDVHLPHVDGIEATTRLRQRQAALPASDLRRHLPLVVGVTADSSADTSRRCLESGMLRVLLKPLSLAAFLHNMDEFASLALEVAASLEASVSAAAQQAPEAAASGSSTAETRAAASTALRAGSEAKQEATQVSREVGAAAGKVERAQEAAWGAEPPLDAWTLRDEAGPDARAPPSAATSPSSDVAASFSLQSAREGPAFKVPP